MYFLFIIIFPFYIMSTFKHGKETKNFINNNSSYKYKLEKKISKANYHSENGFDNSNIKAEDEKVSLQKPKIYTIAKPDRPKSKPLIPYARNGGSSIISTATPPSVLETSDWPSLAVQPSVNLINDASNVNNSSDSTFISKVTQSTNNASARSSTDQPSIFLAPSMPAPVKLLDDFGVFHEQSVLEYLVDGSSGFLVVGVIGLQGVGKSSLLNALISDSGAPGDVRDGTHFDEAGTVQLLNNSVRTSGVDLLCTRERLFLLDSQAVLSLSTVDNLTRTAGVSYTTSSSGMMAPHYTQVDSGPVMAALQTAAFLLSVCHVLLVVTDQAADLSLLHILETADMLRPTAPSSLTPTGSNSDEFGGSGMTGEHVARLEVIMNKAQRAAMNIPAHYRLTSLLGSLLKQTPTESSPTGAAGGLTTNRALNLTVLPRVQEILRDNSWSRLEWEKRMQQLRRRLLAGSRSSLAGALACTVSGQPQAQIAPGNSAALPATGGISSINSASLAQAAAFSEKKWLHFANKVWDNIKKSSMFADYHHLLT